MLKKGLSICFWNWKGNERIACNIRHFYRRVRYWRHKYLLSAIDGNTFKEEIWKKFVLVDGSDFILIIFQTMHSWILFGLFSLVHGQLDIPSLNENPRGNFGRRPPPTEGELQDILARLDFLGTERCSANVAAQWSYETDVNEYTQIQAVSTKYPPAYRSILFKIPPICNLSYNFHEFVTETPAYAIKVFEFRVKKMYENDEIRFIIGPLGYHSTFFLSIPKVTNLPRWIQLEFNSTENILNHKLTSLFIQFYGLNYPRHRLTKRLIWKFQGHLSQ